ncbi:MAG: acetylornithine transaminase, partial [Pseudomonadota bacterium]
MGTYGPRAFAAVRGAGSYLYDAEGCGYLDFTSGIAVTSLGHCHPKLVAALNAQAQSLWHASNLFDIPGQSDLAAMLCNHSFADKVFFTNSGAEALECAIKTARRYQHHKGCAERYKILTFEGGFHGRTLATIAAAGQAKLIDGFGPMPEGFVQLPLGDVEAVAAAIDAQTAAMIIEPILGEGGIQVVPAAFLSALRALCDTHGLLLIFDEVQCGIARTGHLFAHQAADVMPDIMALAKGLGGGFPIGACLA